MNDNDPRRELMLLLQGTPGEVLHYPYTETFDRIYDQLKTTGFVGDKHALWELILQVQASPPADDTPSAPQLSGHEAENSPGATSNELRKSEVPALAQGVDAQMLFDHVIQPQQRPTWQPPLPEALAKKRQELLAQVSAGQFGTVERRVLEVLRRYPETRDNIRELYVRYWQKYDAAVLEEFGVTNLDFFYRIEKWSTIERTRSEIQNQLQLFRGSAHSKQYKLLYQRELEEYIASHKDTVPEVQFYLDETGNEGQPTYSGIGGICVMNWKQYEMHAAALALEREKLGPETIHFVEATENGLDRPFTLLAELAKRRSGLLFVGHAMRSRGSTREALFSLFTQVIVDALHHMRDNGCIHEPRTLRIIKEAEPGFDALHLEGLTQEITELVAEDFPNQVKVLPVEAVPKGRTPFLECADLIASGMRRREEFKGRKAKDRLAEAIFNVTGFEDASDDGMLFKLHR